MAGAIVSTAELFGNTTNKKTISTQELLGESKPIEQKTPARQDLIYALAGTTPEQLAEQGKPLLGAIQSAGRDILTIPAHFVNQLALDYPRQITRKLGYEYPERAENKIVQGAAYGGGVLGALTNPLAKLGTGAMMAKNIGTGGKILRGAGIGATYGGAWAPNVDQTGSLLAPKERATSALIGAGLGAAIPAVPAMVKYSGRILSGVDKQTIQELEKQGINKVLRKKYYDKKMPEVIKQKIIQNISQLEQKAGEKYQSLVEPLKKQTFDFSTIKDKVRELAREVRTNPFKGQGKDLNLAVINGIESSNPKNFGEVLDLRRQLDEVIYNARGQGIGTEFSSKVRNLFNDVLHYNPVLKQADAEWYSLRTILKDIGKKVQADTGSNFLSRFGKLTAQQKEKLIMLEQEIGGEPFVQDLTRYSLAQQFMAKPRPVQFTNPFSLFGQSENISRAMGRATLKNIGRVESIGKGIQKIQGK